MKRFIKAICIALMGVLLFSMTVLAAWEYYFPTTIVDTSATARPYYPVLMGYGGQSLVNSGKIAATGLDTNMQIGTSSIDFMMSTEEVGAVLPNLPSGGHATCSLYTGWTPNQTEFPIIVGDNGRFEYADAAALELAQTFDIEFDGYVNTSLVHYPLIYKPGAFLVDVSAAGTITAGAINVDSYDVTPAFGGAGWHDVDVSNYIPTDASGVVVEIDTLNVTLNTGLRMNGSTDDRRVDTSHYWSMVGVDSSSIFEVYLENNTIDVYLRAYTDDNWTYKTNADDVSLGVFNAWTDIDVSTEAPNATGVLINIINNDAAAGRQAGLRKNGSTDNRHPDVGRGGVAGQTYRLVGLDDSQIFEGYAETLDVDFYLMGYVTGGATFADDATDKSLGGAGAWTNVDCSVEAPDATYLFFENNISVLAMGIGFREEGSSDNIVTDVTEWQSQGIVKCDIAQICEAWEENVANSAFYLMGYSEYGIYPPFPNPTYLVSSSVGGGAMASGVKNIKITGTGGGGNLVLEVNTVTDSNAIGAGVTDTTNNWRVMSLAIPYMDDYYHNATAALRITYLPANMLAGNVVEDLTTAFDGYIAWGHNNNASVAYGEMVSFEDTDAVASDVGGFTMEDSPMPSTWFGDASGVANLPAYDSFNAVAVDIGMPVQTIYFWVIIGLAFGTALFVIVFTRSALFGVMAMTIVLFVGSSQTIIPMWIPFSILIVDIGIMYLYRQVSY